MGYLVIMAGGTSLNLDDAPAKCMATKPVLRFPAETAAIVKAMKSKGKVDSRALYKDDGKGAVTAAALDHWAAFGTPKAIEKQISLLLKGQAFQSWDAGSLNKADQAHCQKHVRLLDPVFGLLRPYDVVNPYRLEMSTPLAIQGASSLMGFWAPERLAQAMKDELNAMGPGPHFVVYHLQFDTHASAHNKQARGGMCRWLAQSRIESPEDVKAFPGAGKKSGAWEFSYEFGEDVKKSGQVAYTKQVMRFERPGSGAAGGGKRKNAGAPSTPKKATKK